MTIVTSSDAPENDVSKVRRDIAIEFLELVGSGRPREGLRFFAPDCRTHNPYTAGSMADLVEAMVAVQQQQGAGVIQGSTADFKLTIRQVLADGDLVAVHTQLASPRPSDGGLRQVHLFRFRGDQIIEYWDITQLVPKDAPNAGGAFS